MKTKCKYVATILSSSLVALLFLTGCVGPSLSQEERLEREREKTIYDRLYQSGAYQFFQDKDGNRVAYAQAVEERIGGEFTQRRGHVKWMEMNCVANGGKFELERAGVSGESSAIAAAYSASIAAATMTASFWTKNGISAPASVRNTFDIELATRMRMVQSAEFMFDSAVRTENVGSFRCSDVGNNFTKWRVNVDLYNAHRGYVGGGGNYRTSNYSAYWRETFILYEKEVFKPGKDGLFAKLPATSEELIYPLTGYYVIIEKGSAKWRVSSISPYASKTGSNTVALTNAPKRINENQEVLIVSQDANFIVPVYADSSVNYQVGEIMGGNVCHIDQLKYDNNKYSVCHSAFTDEPTEFSGAIKVGIILFGNANANYNAKLKRNVNFSEEKFRSAVIEASIADVVRSYSASASSQDNGAAKKIAKELPKGPAKVKRRTNQSVLKKTSSTD
jgi:hypothetical protein